MRLSFGLAITAALSAAGCGSRSTPSSLVKATDAAAEGSAFYRITLQATWSTATHGATGYPQTNQGNAFRPHFTNLAVVTHNQGYSMFKVGELASANLEGIAEAADFKFHEAEWPEQRAALGTNAFAGCRAEQKAANAAEFNQRCLGVQAMRAPSPADAPTSFVLEVKPGFSLISMASMLAPSPDWFIGISGIDLREGGDWLASKTMQLLAKDAGTEKNGGFVYNNPAESPRKPIKIIEGAPFGDVPVATLSFERLEAASAEEVGLRSNEPLFVGFQDGVPAPARLGE